MSPRVVRSVGLDELPVVRELLDRDPVANVFVTSRLDAALRRAGLTNQGQPVVDPVRVASAPGSSKRAAMRSGRADAARTRPPLLDRAWLGGDLWAYTPTEKVEALCFLGGNVVPVGAGPQALAAFGAALSKQPRWAASLVGPADAVLQLWLHLGRAWGNAREVRPCQPLLVIDGPAAVAPDPLIRRGQLTDVDELFPASVAMFTEEVGVSPMGTDGGAAYRARLREIVVDGHSFVRIDDTAAGRQVVFKAEIGHATSAVCQVQGVWVPPERRGQGLGTAGMAAVVNLARRDVAPVVSLYVNDFNAAARSAYDRVGFRRVGTFATVLL